MPPRTQLLSDPAVVAASLHPLRQRMLAMLDTPDSATGLARRLGESRQKVNYHLRALEDLGLLRLVEERPRRGVVERLMARVHDVIVVDPGVADVQALADLDRRDKVGMAGVIGAAVDLLRHGIAAGAMASSSGRRLPVSTLTADIRLEGPDVLRSFTADLADLIARYDHPTPGAMRFRFTAALLPQIPKGTPDA